MMEITQDIREYLASELEDTLNPKNERSDDPWVKGFWTGQLIMIERLRGIE